MPDEPRDWEALREDAFDKAMEVLDDHPVACRVTDAILAVFDKEAVNRLGAEMIADTKIKAMEFRAGGRMDLEPSRDAAAIWTGAARGLLENTGAENYVEIEMQFGLAGDPQRYAFTCQRVGRLTPHQARKQAEAERDKAREAIGEYEKCAKRSLVPNERIRAQLRGRAGLEETPDDH